MHHLIHSLLVGFGALWLASAPVQAQQNAAPTAASAVPGTPHGRADALRERLVHPDGDVVVIAHRGCWKTTAENSLAAVRECVRLGVDGLEFDVRHSRDGVPVVLHDETVDRTTDGHGKVADLTLAQLKALRLRAGHGGRGAPLIDQTIPTLDEFLAAARGELLLVFDVKDLSQRESFQVAQRAGVERQAIFFFECASGLLLDQIEPFKEHAVVVPIVFGNDGPAAASIGRCASTPPGLVHIKFEQAAFLEAPAAKAALRGKRVWVNTMDRSDAAGHADQAALADPCANWGWLLQAGANMLMTNEPAALLRFLRTAGAQPGGCAARH